MFLRKLPGWRRGLAEGDVRQVGSENNRSGRATFDILTCTVSLSFALRTQHIDTSESAYSAAEYLIKIRNFIYSYICKLNYIERIEKYLGANCTQKFLNWLRSMGAMSEVKYT